MQHGVVFLPGIIAPAAVRYRALIEALRGVQASMHDLAVYDGEVPPSGYSISTEIDALDRFADAAQLDQFHVFGVRRAAPPRPCAPSSTRPRRGHLVRVLGTR